MNYQVAKAGYATATNYADSLKKVITKIINLNEKA